MLKRICMMVYDIAVTKNSRAMRLFRRRNGPTDLQTLLSRCMDASEKKTNESKRHSTYSLMVQRVNVPSASNEYFTPKTTSLLHVVSAFKGILFLVACYAILHPALSVRRSVALRATDCARWLLG